MRRVFNVSVRGVAAVLVIVGLSGSMLAAPREARGPRDRSNPIMKIIKKIVVALGDGLTIPTPKP